MLKRITSIVLALCILCTLTLPVFAAGYKDTANHWAKKAIDEWSDYGIVKGEPNGNFYPDRQMTRAEAGQIMVRLLKLTEKADISKLTDVKSTDWFADAVAKCVAAGILKGVSETEMDPNGTLTREMFFVMFARALGFKEEDKLTVGTTDMDKCSRWAKGYINALLNHGYVRGIDVVGGKIVVAPERNINRASAVSLLDQTVTTYITEDKAAVKPEGKGIILVVADNVTLTEVPVGTTVVTGEAKGTTVNGKAISDHTIYIVEEDKPEPKPHEHKFGESTATCTHDGVKTCECGETVVDKATGHDFVNGKCTRCGITENEAMKLQLEVTSGKSTVKVTVYDDYSFVATVPNTTVDASEFKATVRMQNISSLDIGKLREHTATLNTGITGHDSISLQSWLSNAWTFGKAGSANNAAVNFDIAGKTASYAVYAPQDVSLGSPVAICGTPKDIEAARAAWEALAANIKTESGLDNDSYFTLVHGSYLRNGTEKLGFDKSYNGNLTLNNVGDLLALKQHIRDAVKLETVEGKDIEAFVAAGTTLKVGATKAVLTKDTKITVDTSVDGALTKLGAAVNGDSVYALAEALVDMVNGMLGSVQGKTVNVAVSFS